MFCLFKFLFITCWCIFVFFLKNVVESWGEKMDDRNESALENCCAPCKDVHISLFILRFFLHSYFPVRNSRFPTSICCYHVRNLQCQRQAWTGLKIKCLRCKTWKWNHLWHHTHNNGPGVKLSWAQPMIHGEDFWEFLGCGLLQSCEQKWRCQCLFPFAYSTNKWMWSLQLYSQGVPVNAGVHDRVMSIRNQWRRRSILTSGQ